MSKPENIKGSIASNLRRSLIVQNFEMPDDSSHNNDKNCAVCQAEFGKIGIIHAKKHVCKFCHRGVCAKCSPEKIMHPTSKSLERICASCLGKMMESHFSQGFQKQIRELKEEKTNRHEELKIMRYEKEHDIAENLVIEGKIKEEDLQFEARVKEIKAGFKDLQDKQEESRILFRGKKEGLDKLLKEVEVLKKVEDDLLGEVKEASAEREKRKDGWSLLVEKGKEVEEIAKGLKEMVKQGHEVDKVNEEKALEASEEMIKAWNDVEEVNQENFEIEKSVISEEIESRQIEILQVKAEIEEMVADKNEVLHDCVKIGGEILKELEVCDTEMEKGKESLEKFKGILKETDDKLQGLKKNKESFVIENNNLDAECKILESELGELKKLRYKQKENISDLESTKEDLDQVKSFMQKCIDEKKVKAEAKIQEMIKEQVQQMETELNTQEQVNSNISLENQEILKEIELLNQQSHNLLISISFKELQEEMIEKHEIIALNTFFESSIEQEKNYLENLENKTKNLNFEMQSKKENLASDLNKMTKINQDFTNESVNLEHLLTSLDIESKDLIDLQSSNKKIVNDLELNLNNLQEIKNNLLKQKEEMISEYFTNKTQEFSNEIDEENYQILVVQNENSILNDEIEYLTIENEINERKEIIIELNHFIYENNLIKEQNELIQTELNQENEIAKGKIDRYEKSIEELKVFKDSFIDKLKDLKEINIKFDNELNDLNQVSSSLEGELNLLKENEVSNKELIVNLQTNFEEAKNEKQEIVGCIGEKQQAMYEQMIKEKTEKLAKELEETEIMNNVVVSQNFEVDQEAFRLTEENLMIEKSILSEELKDLLAETQEISTFNNNLEILISKESEISQLKQNLFAHSIQSHNETLSTLKSKISSLTSATSEISNQSLLLNPDQYSQELESLKASQKSSKILISSLELSLNQLQETNLSLKSSKQDIENQIRNLTNDYESQFNSINLLENENFSINLEINQNELETLKINQKIIENLKDELRDQEANSQLIQLENEILQESKSFDKENNENFELRTKISALSKKSEELKQFIKSTENDCEKSDQSIQILQIQIKDSKVGWEFNQSLLPYLSTRLEELVQTHSTLSDSLESQKEALKSQNLSEQTLKLSQDLESKTESILDLEKENLNLNSEISQMLNETQSINERLLSNEILSPKIENDSLISTSSSKYSPEEEEKIRELRNQVQQNRIKINELKVLLEGNAIMKKRSLLDTDKSPDPSSRPCARCSMF